MMSVTFSDPADPIFARLAQTASHWSSSELFIDEKPIDLTDAMAIVRCHLKPECDGICSRERGIYFPDSAKRMIKSIANADPWQGYYLSYGPDPAQRTVYSFLSQISPKRFELSKDAMYDEIREKFELERVLCDKFDSAALRVAIDRLPDDFEGQENTLGKVAISFEEAESDEYLGEYVNVARVVAEEVAPIIAKAIGSELKDLLRELVTEQRSKKVNARDQ
jgi:hypothetical protein